MAIELRGLCKTFRRESSSSGQDGGDFSLYIDLRIEENETLILAGPSGCGKTTALHLAAGLLRPDGGSILVNDRDITSLPAWKRNVSVVFQDLGLFPHLNVAGNVAYGLFIRGLKKKERAERVREALRQAHLSGYEKRRIHELSGGERQRTAIARALASSPQLLLLDEPFSSLDAPLRKAMREEFLEIRSSSSIPCIFVTHDREEAAFLGDRIALMKEGRIVESGKTEELFLSPRTSFCAEFLDAGIVLASGDDKTVFIPHDAVRIAGEGESREEMFQVSGILKKTVFEGRHKRFDMELSDGRLVSVKVPLREKTPETGQAITLQTERKELRLIGQAD
ncbi:MAG: ABC transporter ATP-binding protein [Treponema sp.]|jgi:ABC-type Fe3+/spermidine/putrescine transport system ATPase subunit|nr:ABC transporter ATP-binding protein [Treponema sp.]